MSYEIRDARPTDVPGILDIYNDAVLNTLAARGVTWGNPDEGAIVRRGPDRDARDSGQFGVALRWFAESLNDTEFGLYAMNYHSRTPSGSFIRTTTPSADLIPGAPNARYFLEYPEDIRLYGLSFSTTLPTGTAWSGEVSYRPNAPVQLNTTDILFAGVRPIGGALSNASLLTGTPGQDLHGYRRKEITQFQTTLTHFFDQVMGASRMTVVGEVGVTHVGGLENAHDTRYGRDPVFGPGPLPSTGGADTCQALNGSTIAGAGAGTSTTNLNRKCENDGYTTSTSWGYRTRVIWDYNDVFAGVNLKPSVAWSHDVSGYSPGPGANFEEGRKAVSLGLDAEYQNTYTASLSYTNFFDGKYSTVDDRDFVALSFGVNF